ncbi:MAG TPA: sodium:proton exchanger [Acidimicrobiia bacterium]
MTAPEIVEKGSASRAQLYIALAAAAAAPGLIVRFADFHPTPALAALIFGLAIVGAAFILSWAAEVVQLDISGGLALAILALIAVLPEYAVDFVFTWKAGTDLSQAPNALANMTGGNQLLIGFGWPLVVLLATRRVRKLHGRGVRVGGADDRAVYLDRVQSIDYAFLTLASIYGLHFFLRESLTLIDAVILVSLYAAYLFRLAKAPPEAPHLVGPAARIAELGTRNRRIVNIVMFVFSAGAILLVAEPFAESLLELGEFYDIPEFLLVKWLAPLASESPELLVAALFAYKLSARTGFGALLSSKVNQWTLLVGTLPLVFAISSTSFDGLPLGIEQRDELLVTAAQSMFAVAILASRSMDRKEAWVLLGLFIAQLFESFYVSFVLDEEYNAAGRVGVAIVFLLAAAWVGFRRLREVRTTVREGLRAPIEVLTGAEER